MRITVPCIARVMLPYARAATLHANHSAMQLAVTNAPVRRLRCRPAWTPRPPPRAAAAAQLDALGTAARPV